MQSGSGSRLVVRRGPQPNQVYELNKDIVTLGRDVTNDITINDPEVSRHHCRFTRGGGGFTMEDLGSTNGSFINGQRLTGARPLSSGDTIGLGETVILIYESAALSPSGPGGYREPQQATLVGGGQQQGYGAPPQQPGGPPPPGGGYYGDPQQGQQGGYGAPPPPPPAAYNYQDEPLPGGGVGRWIFLACGVFIVLCIISSVILIILIDQNCWWDSTPIVSSIVDAIGYQQDVSACS
jgi:hypothetical protein